MVPEPNTLPGRELGRHDGGGEFLEQRLAVAVEAEQQIGHQDRHEPRQCAAEIRLHDLDFGIGGPQRIGGFYKVAPR